jgi:hypothetical protein
VVCPKNTPLTVRIFADHFDSVREWLVVVARTVPRSASTKKLSLPLASRKAKEPSFAFFPTNVHISSHWIRWQGRSRMVESISFSQRSPAKVSKRRIVSRCTWVTVTRSTLLTLIPSTSNSEDNYLLGQIFYSLNEDCQWRRQWSESLVRMAIEDNVLNRDTIQGWITQWHPLAARAVRTFALRFEDTLERNGTPLQHIREAIDCYYRDYLRSMNLQVAG